VKTFIGGAPVNDQFRVQIGADYYSADPQSLVGILNSGLIVHNIVPYTIKTQYGVYLNPYKITLLSNMVINWFIIKAQLQIGLVLFFSISPIDNTS
jgi:hypothetical protein